MFQGTEKYLISNIANFSLSLIFLLKSNEQSNFLYYCFLKYIVRRTVCTAQNFRPIYPFDGTFTKTALAGSNQHG